MKFEQLNQHLFEQISAEDMSQINGGARMDYSLTGIYSTDVQNPADSLSNPGSFLDATDIDF